MPLYSGVVKELTGEWNDALFSSVMTLYASDGHTHVWHRPGERHLPECPWHTSSTSGFMVWRSISCNLQSHMVFLQGKINSAWYFAEFVNPVLLPFLRQEGNVLFEEGNAHPHTYSSWCTTALASKVPRSLANWTRMGHEEAGTYSFSRACHNHCWIATMDAWCLGQSIAGWHLAALWPFACKNTRLHYCQREVYCVLMWLFGHPLLWHVFFIWSEFVIIYSYNYKLQHQLQFIIIIIIIIIITMINYLSQQISIQWTCPWRCCIFYFRATLGVKEVLQLSKNSTSIFL